MNAITIDIGDSLYWLFVMYLVVHSVLRHLTIRSLEKRDWIQWDTERRAAIRESHHSKPDSSVFPEPQSPEEQPIVPKYPG